MGVRVAKSKTTIGRKRIPTPSLRNLLQQISTGGFDAVPDQILLNLRDLNQDDVLAFMEIARLKSFGPGYSARLDRLLGPGTGGRLGDLHLCQSLVEAGSFGAVIDRLEQREPRDPDLVLQKIRARVFIGEYRSSLEDLRSLLARSDLDLATRGVCHQVMGHCLFEVGDFRSAIECLEIAIQIAAAAENRQGRLAAQIMLVRVFCLIDDLGRAQSHFAQSIEEVAKADESFRWLIALYRAWSFLLYCQGNSRCFDKAMAAAALAESIGDHFFFYRSTIDAALMARGMGARLGLDAARMAQKLMEQKEISTLGDMGQWIDALGNRESKGDRSATLRFLTRRAPFIVPLADLTSASTGWISQSLESGTLKTSWLLDKDLAWIADLTGKSLRSFQGDSPLLKLLEALNTGDALPIETAFETAWGIRWNEAVHGNTIGVALSRINAKKASFSVTRRGGRLSLANRGAVV